MKCQRKGTNDAIQRRLNLHARLTKQLIADGWGQTSASHVAYDYVRKFPNQPKHEYEAAKKASIKLEDCDG